jgi:hypothetical protein
LSKHCRRSSPARAITTTAAAAADNASAPPADWGFTRRLVLAADEVFLRAMGLLPPELNCDPDLTNFRD